MRIIFIVYEGYLYNKKNSWGLYAFVLYNNVDNSNG